MTALASDRFLRLKFSWELLNFLEQVRFMAILSDAQLENQEGSYGKSPRSGR